MSEILAKTEEIVKKGKALGADEVIAKTVLGRNRQTRFSNNQIDISVAWNYYVTDVVLSWKNRVVATQIPNFQNVDQSIKNLFKLAKVSKENPMHGGFAKGKFKYQKSQADKTLADLENPAEYVFEAIVVGHGRHARGVCRKGLGSKPPTLTAKPPDQFPGHVLGIRSASTVTHREDPTSGPEAPNDGLGHASDGVELSGSERLLETSAFLQLF